MLAYKIKYLALIFLKYRREVWSAVEKTALDFEGVI